MGWWIGTRQCALLTEGPGRDLAGWAQHGPAPRTALLLGSVAASAVDLVHGIPLGWAVTGAQADGRDVLIEILSTTMTLVSDTRAAVMIIGDKKLYNRRALEAPRAEFTDKLAKLIVLRRV